MKSNKTIIGLIVIIILVWGGWYLLKNSGGDEGAEVVTPTTETSADQATTTNSSVNQSSIYLTSVDTVKGSYMTDSSGMTLYTFDKDKIGISNCTGSCLKIWPAYTPGVESQGQLPTNISIITRPDGSTQYAWKGMPLYHYVKDVNVGDLNGDGVNGTWHIIKL